MGMNRYGAKIKINLNSCNQVVTTIETLLKRNLNCWFMAGKCKKSNVVCNQIMHEEEKYIV